MLLGRRGRVPADRRRHDDAVGYAGGQVDNPSYEQVCRDNTGHAEVVEVTYDAEKVPYEQLLAVFWAEHDPTQVNRQGPDVGAQYRSAIFMHDEAQRAAAEASRAQVQARLGRPVATRSRTRRRSGRPRTTTSSTSRSAASRAARLASPASPRT